jgi:pimeloyl-ACP methyl ester carboxylesterase
VSGTDGWEVYTRDQLALLDHLGIEHFHGVGMCIGGPYLFGLIRAAPERVRSAVMLQPIGLRDNREAFFRLFDAWAAELAPIRTETTEQDWLAFRSNMFGGDFVFNATREEVAACPTPLLILRGNDLYHPEAISREIASLAPNARLVEHWKDEPALGQADQTIRSFLRQWSESPSG